MKKWLLLFAGVALLIFNGCGEKPISAPFQQIQQIQQTLQDELFLSAEVGDESVFYLVEQGKERKRIGSDVVNFLFLENSKSIFYVDGEQRLYFQREGNEKEMVTNDVVPFVVVSEDESVVAYLKINGDSMDLYTQEIGEGQLGERLKITTGVQYYHSFKLSEDGTNIVFVNEKGDLYLKKGEDNPLRVGRNILHNAIYDGFFLFPGGNEIAFINKDRDLYLYDIEAEETRKTNAADVVDLSISNDGSVLAFLSLQSSDIKYYDGLPTSGGELYTMVVDKDPQWVASDIISFFLTEDGRNLYYVNIDKQLFCRNLHKEKGDRVASDVTDFILSPSGTGIYLDKNSDLHSITAEGEKNRIASDVTHYVFFGEGVLFLNEDQVLYFHAFKGETVEKSPSVKAFCVAPNHTAFAFVNNENEIFLCRENEIPSLVLDAEEKYCQVYFLNQLLHVGTVLDDIFDPDKLIGIWESKCEENILEITPENTIVFHFMEGININLMGELPELPFDIIGETENTATIKTNMFDEEMDIELTIMGVDHIMLDDTEYFRITKDELEKTLKYLGGTDAGYHELGIPTGVSDIASEIMYEYIYVPYGLEARYKPEFSSKVIGNFQEGGYYYVVDVFVDSNQVIWAQIEVPFDEIPDYYWIVYL